MAESAKVRPIRADHGIGRERGIDLVILGLSHRTAPVELRERLAFPEETLGQATRRLLEIPAIGEGTVISTCNRVELVTVVARGAEVVGPLTEFLARERAAPSAVIAEHRYVRSGRAALRHLFRVAASLDSMVVGEPQILGQLKSQFRLASESGAARRLLRRCFDKAFAVAKRVRRETAIASKAVSVSSAAVELARQIFDHLNDKTAMLVGAGKMSQLAARHLLRQGIAGVLVTNRSFDRAVELARVLGGTPVPFEQFANYLHLADVVLGSVATTGYLVGPTLLQDVLRVRRRRPMFFIDLGVPRNFDPAINNLDNVYLYNIDDLANVTDDNRVEREREATRAEAIVEQEVDGFWHWFSGRDLTPTIVALRGRFEAVRQAELARTLAQLSQLGPAERRSVEAMSQAIVNKLLHGPTSLLKQAARDEDGDAAGELLEVVHRLFGLEFTDDQLADHEPVDPQDDGDGDG